MEPVFVDTREPISMVNRITALGYQVELIQMPISDYKYFEVGIERKASDFLNLGDVMTKATELRSAFPKPFLLVEGDLGTLIRQSKIYYKRDMEQNILGMVASLALQGIPPIFCSSDFYLAGLMNKLFIKSQDGKVRGENINPLRPIAKNEDYLVRILSGLPNISDVIAGRILEHYKNPIYDMCLATIKELQSIEGIGKNKAESIKTYFHD